ncbi:hypothetical protein [Mariniphaga sp.]|uniref:hypothetical protein n=1 Tax=Mariniphaga sp. TaxID=1954475 RepID=UPI003566BBF2
MNQKSVIKSSQIKEWKKYLKFIFVVFFLTGSFYDLSGQATVNDSLPLPVGAPYVYLDCRRCDFDYIRTELTFVNYVRDPELADIHVFVTDERTSGGGYEYQFSFIGRQNFEGTGYTLKYHIDHNATSEERRIRLTEYLKLGLTSFVLQTPMATSFKIEYDGNGEHYNFQENNDPWDYWVFQIYVGSVELELETNQSEFDSRWGVFADRVTEDWKLRIRPYFNYDRVKIETAERDEPVISSQHRHGLDSYAIKSISQHWSAGLFGTYLTYNGRNIRHEFILSPGIEYSIFPYEVATRKSITFTYQIGYGYYDYYKETIFGKNQENLFNHEFEGVVNIQQPWGSIEMGLEGSQYLHDIKRRSIEFFGQTSVRLFEGFSLNFQAQYDVVRDQLSLPKGEATLEEILLRQRELATDYNFSTSVAITYTFGSKFTNIVNTRF